MPKVIQRVSPVAIFLFDLTGVMAKPWLEKGYECWCVDIQHPKGITREGSLVKVHHNLMEPWNCPIPKQRIKFVACFPPCDHLAVSGARWFKGKGLRLLADSIQMFATAAEFCEWSEASYMIENPVSTISSYWRKPDFKFHPHYFTRLYPQDNYVKKTCLWVGNDFRMPEKDELENLPPPDDRMFKAGPSPNRKNFRSATPLGFSKAVFKANHKL